jgi:GTPase involved in cell partitioning and DNA repair
MYVHIGKDFVINSENIVAIIDISKLRKKKSVEEILQKIRKSVKIVNVTMDNQKSLIILNKNLAYVTNISTATLAKRASDKKRK